MAGARRGRPVNRVPSKVPVKTRFRLGSIPQPGHHALVVGKGLQRTAPHRTNPFQAAGRSIECTLFQLFFCCPIAKCVPGGLALKSLLSLASLRWAACGRISAASGLISSAPTLWCCCDPYAKIGATSRLPHHPVCHWQHRQPQLLFY